MILKRLIRLILGGSLLIAGALPIAQAQDCDPTTDADCLEGVEETDSFDVGSILSTEGQEQAYFDEETAGSDVPLLAFILDVVNFITQIVGAIAMILIIAGGLLMIVSEGDENRLQRGKGMLESAIVGLILALSSYIIVRFVQSLFYIQ